jgi:alkanesulfonate monooxygenase SsuD/methylene tetrahydromethanopterin reductase-like flavin-dependent oxidoreductase (luciferase family)
MLLFDMQTAPFGTATAKLFPAMLEMTRFGDRAGFDRICIPEHHGTDTGYLPSPVALTGAVAATTERLKIVLMIILPLYNPVRVAEDIAVLDLISQGRLEVIFGVGYVPSEFKLLQVPMKQRGRLFEEGVELVINALKGARFEAGGREVFVSPLPFQRPHPTLYIAGSMQIAARRAARFGVGFAPLNGDLWATYDEECAALGKEPGAKLGWGGPINVYVAEDPESAWARIEPYVSHHAGSYIRWASESLASGARPGTTYAQIDPQDIRKSGKHRVLTPDECVALASELEAVHRPLILQPLIGGLPPEEGWKSLELFAKTVLPRLSRGNIQERQP